MITCTRPGCYQGDRAEGYDNAGVIEMRKSVLMVGWHPSVVNYEKYPGLSPEALESALRADEARLKDLGYDAELAFVRSPDTAADDLTAALKAKRYDVVMIGAGVRRDDDHFLTFEQLVNAVHEHAPEARIAFNTGPHDSEAAVLRWA